VTDTQLPLNATIIEKQRGLANLQLDALWQYRELLYFFVWKDVKIRYKQTVLGILWIVLQPLIVMVVFSIIFGNLLGVPSGNIPYPIFAYAALLPWNYFTGALNRSSNILVANSNLLTKVFFPRMILPLSGVLAGLVDFGVSFVIYLIIMLFYKIQVTPAILAIPVFLGLAIITALGFSFWFSALNVRYRDVIYILPFILQVWMYVTPVIYDSSLIPEQFRGLLIFNPMTGVVDGFRWALLGTPELSPAVMPLGYAASFGVALIVLMTGFFYFRNTERSFADIV
jgi:lipopolysaccharide transport system permease protein